MYNNTLATVKCQVQQAENLTPAMVISMEAVRVHNAILIHHLPSEVALEQHVIGRTNPNITIDINCTNDELYFGMPGCSSDYEVEGDEHNVCDAIPTTSLQRWPATELERFELGTSDVDGNEGEDGDNADADEEEEASQANDGSTQNGEDRGHSKFDLRTSDVDDYEGEDSGDSDTD